MSTIVVKEVKIMGIIRIDIATNREDSKYDKNRYKSVESLEIIAKQTPQNSCYESSVDTQYNNQKDPFADEHLGK